MNGQHRTWCVLFIESPAQLYRNAAEASSIGDNIQEQPVGIEQEEGLCHENAGCAASRGLRLFQNSVVPPGLGSFSPLLPPLKRWAKLVRPSRAGFLWLFLPPTQPRCEFRNSLDFRDVGCWIRRLENWSSVVENTRTERRERSTQPASGPLPPATLRGKIPMSKPAPRPGGGASRFGFRMLASGADNRLDGFWRTGRGGLPDYFSTLRFTKCPEDASNCAEPSMPTPAPIAL